MESDDFERILAGLAEVTASAALPHAISGTLLKSQMRANIVTAFMLVLLGRTGTKKGEPASSQCQLNA
jgi:hypothetical protein